MNESNSNKRSPYRLGNIRSAIGYYLIGRGASAIAGVVSSILLVRYMGVSEYAGYTAMFGVAGVFAMLSSLGLERAVTRYVPEGRMFQTVDALKSFVWRLLLVRFGVVLFAIGVLALLWTWIISLFGYISLPVFPVAIAIYIIATSIYQFSSTVLQALLRQKLLTQIAVLQWGGRLVSIVILVAIDGNISLQQSLWIMAAPELLGMIATVVAVRGVMMSARQIENECKDGSEWPNWYAVRSLAIHSYGFNLLAMMPQGYFMRALISATQPIEIVAAYGFFSNLVDRIRMYLPAQLMYNLIEPVLVARYLENKDKKDLVNKAKFIYMSNYVILIFALGFTFVLGDEFVSLLTAGKYMDKSWILALLIVQLMLGSHTLTMQLIFTALNKNHILTIASATSAVSTAITIFLIINYNEQQLIIFMPLFFATVTNVVSLYLSRKKSLGYAFPIAETVKVLGLLLLVCTLTFLVLDIRPDFSFFTKVIITMFSMILLSFLVVVAKCISVKELGLIMKMARQQR